VGRAIASARGDALRAGAMAADQRLTTTDHRLTTNSERCPKCGCDDPSMLELPDARSSEPTAQRPKPIAFCNNCSHDWLVSPPRARFASLDELVARTGLRRDELVTLADVGALNAFGYDRRSALWQAERAIRPSGELFTDHERQDPSDQRLTTSDHRPPTNDERRTTNDHRPPASEAPCPLRPMTEAERLVADYAGTGLTVGRHPMALRRQELAMQGILRASDLRSARPGRRVRVAGMVITRQRPGTAKGFVFLTLEDETGVANIIVRPDLFARERLVIVEEPFLIVDGVLQNQDGVTSVRAEQVQGMHGVDIDFDAHDFY
jgi:error-prone DNA polymerase